jgi:solute carrier family 35 protein
MRACTQFSFFFSSTLAFFLNYSIYLCTTANSALATSVTGQIKTIASTVLGFLLFDDATPTVVNSIGLAIGVAGSVWYAVAKYRQQAPSAPALPQHLSPPLRDREARPVNI